MEKDKLVVHIARTSLAGAPIRIVNALNKYTNFSARLINFMPIMLNGTYVYEEDLNWQKPEEKQIALDLIKQADILHLHHYMDLRMNPFVVDFSRLIKQDCKVIKHFHSAREYLQRTEIRFDENYAKDVYPKVVIPHCPERTYLDLEILPNVMPIDDELYKPKKVENERLKVVYSASNKNPRVKERWATKAYPEVSQILTELSEKLYFEYIEIAGHTFEDAMKIKQNADIIIGDVATGSYHLTELEGLSLGKPTLTYLDGRSVMTFMNTFKTNDIPFVNVGINELKNALTDLVSSKSLREQIGEFSRKWIEEFYREDVLIKKFVDVYNQLLNNESISRDGSAEYLEVKKFLYNRIYDYPWENYKVSFEQ